MSVFRSFRLTGDHRIEARVEASNVTNTPNFGNPTSSITSGDFMRILSLYGSYAERQIRLAVATASSADIPGHDPDADSSGAIPWWWVNTSSFLRPRR